MGAIASRQRAILLVLAAVQFTNVVDFMIVMPLGPRLMAALHIGPGQFGLIVSSYTFSACVAGLLAAFVVDRLDRKAAFLGFYVGFLVGTLLCGFAPTYSTLLAARVVTGAFGGIVGGLALTIIGDVFPEERRGAATGILMSGFAIASVVGVPLGLKAGDLYGWHAPFWFLAGLGTLVLPVAIWAMPRIGGHLDHSGRVRSPVAELWSTMTEGNHLRAFALVVALMLGGFSVIPYIATYLVKNVGVANQDIWLVFTVGGALSFVAAPGIGRMADRFGKLRVYRIVAPVAGVLILIITHLPRLPVALALIPVGLLMASNSGRMVVAMAMVTGCVEPRRRGSFMSVNSAVQHFSMGLGAYVGGLMLGQAADGSLTHFDRVGYFAFAATALTLYLAGRLRPDNSSVKPEPVAELMDDPMFSIPAAESL